MTRPTARQMLDHARLIGRRARGREPGDDLLSRLRLDELARAPAPWLRMAAAKLAVLLVLALLAAGVFSGGIAIMRAMGVAR